MPRLLRPFVLFSLCVLAPSLFAQPLAYVTDPTANTMNAVDTGTNTIARTIPNLSGADAVAISSDGTRVYVSESASGKIAVFDGTKISNPNQNPLIKELAIGGQPVGLALSPDNKTLYVADAQNDQAEAVDLNSGEVTKQYAAGSGVRALALSPAGHLLAIGANDKTVTLYTLPWQSGFSAVKTVVSLSAAPKALAFDAQGRTLWIATGAGFSSYDRNSGAVTDHPENGGTTSVAYSPRLNLVYAGAGTGNLVYTYVPGAGTVGQIGTYKPVRGLALSPDGTRLYAVQNCSNCGVAVISTAQGQALTQVSFGTAPVTAGQFVGPGPIYAAYATTNSSVGEQISGTVTATDGKNRSLTYSTLITPTLGQLSFNATGDYAYTPPPGYSGLQAFVWQAAAGGGDGSPNLPYSRPITQSLAISPTVSSFDSQSADSGATIGPLTFTIAGTTPLTVTVTSNNNGVVNPAKATISSGCGTGSLNCSLTLVAGKSSGQSARVTVQVTDPGGLVASTYFKVTIKGGSGGGALVPWSLALLAALAGFAALRRRRHGNLRER